jgi:hypothetical protein
LSISSTRAAAGAATPEDNDDEEGDDDDEMGEDMRGGGGEGVCDGGGRKPSLERITVANVLLRALPPVGDVEEREAEPAEIPNPWGPVDMEDSVDDVDKVPFFVVLFAPSVLVLL